MALTAVRSGYGLVQLVVPGLWSGRAQPCLKRVRQHGGGQQVVRVLGARHLVQAGLSEPEPTSAVLALGAAVDLLHAGSMVGLAVVDRRWRRVALADGAVAFAFAAAGGRAARSARRRPPVSTRGLVKERDRWAQALAHRVFPRRLFPEDGHTPPTQQSHPLGGVRS